MCTTASCCVALPWLYVANRRCLVAVLPATASALASTSRSNVSEDAAGTGRRKGGREGSRLRQRGSRGVAAW